MAQASDIFSYHNPGADGVEHITKIKDAARKFYEVILQNCPSCADRTTALRCVREAMLWANASIVLEGAV